MSLFWSSCSFFFVLGAEADPCLVKTHWWSPVDLTDSGLRGSKKPQDLSTPGLALVPVDTSGGKSKCIFSSKVSCQIYTGFGTYASVVKRSFCFLSVGLKANVSLTTCATSAPISVPGWLAKPHMSKTA
ncbi:hypothetical protein TWF106_002100 [Orbilia oligospora]|uniref:Secreted protein n=1 Tax=Orbilia oligospora TaxID=2813651 RepID=A0A7C8Q9B6_ORBOL|nr:hypothetical protein TWF106_002100 [Orbilia oligospora]